MLANRKLIVDTHSEIYDMIKHHADGIFWNLEQHIQKDQVVPDAVYVIGREQIRLYGNQLRTLIDTAGIKAVFSNPHEGSDTLKQHCYVYGIADLILDNKIILVGGGDMDSSWPCLQYDSFLPKILDYDENLAAIEQYSQSLNTNRPYKFLFLNGRTRPHRKYLLERFQSNNLLDQSIWSNLDSTTAGNREISFIHNGQDLMYRPFPIHYLDSKYEVKNYHAGIGQITSNNFVKLSLFNHEWGDVYLRAEPYADTYFSLVTETVYTYPYSFRTEKIWKPIAIGHPWIAVANRGFYRDMCNLGFQTFGNLIDESFDLIDNNQDRIERIATVVEDLCQQDLASFLKECYNVCKYNQQHLAEMRPRVRKDFPHRFEQFINERFRI